MRAHERFLRYIKINTQSDETSGTHPSFKGEFTLAEMLKAELEEMGVVAEVDDRCYLMAHIPATSGYEDAPAIGFISHLDSAPGCSGENIKPIIHENYDGGDVEYPCGKVMRVRDFPILSRLKGETLITSDGTTLLSADDKSGISEIMTAIEILMKEDIPHGKLCIAFTPDEEIGEGADFFDVKKFGADYAYTVDGGDVHEMEYENFNAASAKIKIHGVPVHPGTAKGVMVNAVNVAIELHLMLPADMRPENTEGYEGFFHLTHLLGECESAEMSYIIRNHDRGRFEEMKNMMTAAAEAINEKYGPGTVELDLSDSYYNMLEIIKKNMHLVETAEAAINVAGLEAVSVPIRGGTDGARLSYMGLPCPNLGTGGFNFHGPFECITAERMDRAVTVILSIIEQYARRKGNML
ncbi:MAG: peptidase T [Lachnospiraceae bacterium]|nr:peptidase T [Lachnospiraceae bacterium]